MIWYDVGRDETCRMYCVVFTFTLVAREVPLEGAADPAVPADLVPCASMGRSVGRVCVCVCMCFVVRRYLELRMDLPLRGVRPLASPPELSSANRALAFMPRLGGPLLGGPLHGAVLRGPLPFGGRFCVALFVGFFALLGALRARLAAAVLVGLLRAAAFGRLGCVDTGS